MSRADHLPSSTVWVSLHVFETTRLAAHLHPAEDRITVDVAGSGGMATLFLDRPEIGRLRSVLARAEDELTNQQNETRANCGPAA